MCSTMCVSKGHSAFLTPYKYMPQAGFEPPLVDDTSYEADALPTKPPQQDPVPF